MYIFKAIILGLDICFESIKLIYSYILNEQSDEVTLDEQDNADVNEEVANMDTTDSLAISLSTTIVSPALAIANGNPSNGDAAGNGGIPSNDYSDDKFLSVVDHRGDTSAKYSDLDNLCLFFDDTSSVLAKKCLLNLAKVDIGLVGDDVLTDNFCDQEGRLVCLVCYKIMSPSDFQVTNNNHNS